MRTIGFETPTLDSKGEIVTRTPQFAEHFTEVLGNGMRLDMLVIPSGSFQMGSPHNFGNPDERPQHFVTIKSFMLPYFLDKLELPAYSPP